jgi:hypothetical protein
MELPHEQCKMCFTVLLSNIGGAAECEQFRQTWQDLMFHLVVI